MLLRDKRALRCLGLGVGVLLIVGGLLLENVRTKRRAGTHYDEGVARIHSEDYEGAVKAFTRAIQEDPGISHSYRARGLALTLLERFDESIRDLDKAIELGADDADIHYAKGMYWDKQKKYRKAIEEYSLCIDRSKDEARGFVARAKARDQVRERKTALEDINRALDIDPSDYNTLLRCDILKDMRRFKEALKDADDVLGRQPDQKWALYLRAHIRGSIGDTDGAHADLRRLKELNPESPITILKERLDAGAALDPLVKCERDLEKNPSDWTAYRTRAGLRKFDKDYEAALQDFDRLVEAGQATSEDYYDRADARIHLGDLEGALSDLGRADPKDGKVLYRTAVVQCDLQRYEEAQEIFFRCHEHKDPATLRLWLVRSRLGKKEAARGECGFYADRMRQSGTFGWPARLFDFLAGRCSEEDLLMSIKTMGLGDAYQSQGYFYLGCARLLDGDASAAARWFRECVEAHPDTDEARSAQIELKRR